MIFATVGLHHDGFPRMLAAVEQLPVSEVVFQHGPGRRPSNALLAKPFLSFPEMLEWFKTSNHVITHAGVGSVLLAIRCGHTPIIVPRLHRLGEHVDDHQVDLAKAMEASGRVHVIWDDQALWDVLDDTPPRGLANSLPVTNLHSAVEAGLLRATSSAGTLVEQG